MGRETMKLGRRKYRRVSTDFPVVYRIQGTRLLGKVVNACNEGMMVESYVGQRQALHILENLANNGERNVELKFTHKKKAYRIDGEMRHCHIHSFGSEPFRAQLGLFLPRIDT
jgi:hypothetical protein